MESICVCCRGQKLAFAYILTAAAAAFGISEASPHPSLKIGSHQGLAKPS